MITGYTVGTQVKWNRDNTLTTGVVERVFYEPTLLKIDGEAVHVDGSDDMPIYMVRHYSGEVVLLPHSELLLKQMNLHT